MKHLVVTCLALGLFICTGTAQAKKSGDGEDQILPITKGLIVEMPDGQTKKIWLPTEQPNVNEGPITKELSTVGPPVLAQPPLGLWQSGWFVYQNLLIYGFVGPGNYLYIGIYYEGAMYYWYYNPITASWVYIPS